MDDLNWYSHYDNFQEFERALVDLEMSTKYNEADQDFLHQQEEIFASDQFLHLPLITRSSEEIKLIRNILTFSSSSGNSSVVSDNHTDSVNLKKAKMECGGPTSIDFRREGGEELDGEVIARVKEMMYRAAALRPVSLGVEEMAKKPRRRNTRISNDPQTTAARHRRERISERLRVLQRLVPGGRKMDTASMLDEAANYLKFLKAQVSALEKNGHGSCIGDMKNIGVQCCGGMFPFPVALSHYSSTPMQACVFPLPRE